MNITPQNYNLPIQTAVNLQTDSLRQDNQKREVITKTEAPHPSLANKKAASEKDQVKTPTQQNETVDFSALRKQALAQNSTINDQAQHDHNQDSSQQQSDDGLQNEANKFNQSSEESSDAEQENSPEQRQIEALEKRDAEVKAHELAHASTGGAYAGSPSYSYEIGPDGKKYAVSGEVSIDISPVEGDPRATIAKMKKVQAAALAPVSPSAQDVRVAATASENIRQAQAELAKGDDEKEQDQSTNKVDSGNIANQRFSSDLEQNRSITGIDGANEKSNAVQEQLLSERPLAIEKRSLRIEQFYSSINQAATNTSKHQFELTA